MFVHVTMMYNLFHMSVYVQTLVFHLNSHFCESKIQRNSYRAYSIVPHPRSIIFTQFKNLESYTSRYSIPHLYTSIHDGHYFLF